MRMSRTRKVWVGLLILVAALLGLTIRSLPTGPSVAQAQRAYDRGDWTTVLSAATGVLERNPEDVQATRLRARSLVQLGRLGEALPIAAHLGGNRLEAEDLWLVGQALLREQRPALGWAAIDAAAKLDSKHVAASEALASRVHTKTGSSSQADRLLAVPGGPALGELVVGLASLGGPANADVPESRLLASLLRRDRALFLKLDSPVAARKLLARLLLEAGRAPEAQSWLATADDAESHWLRSRAYLVEGDLERANAAIKLAGTFGADHPEAAEPARYRGAKQCAECHQEIFAIQQSSHHSATLSWGEGLRAVPLPAGPVVDPGNPAVTHQFGRVGQELSLTAATGTETLTAVIDYVLGSGHHGQTMLARESEGRHRSLRLSYYSGGPAWDLTSGFAQKPTDPHDYIGDLLNDESFRNCLNCHTTRFTGESDRQGPEVADHGIGCERCHGPGDHHIRAAESDFSQLAIARPTLATPSARLKLCAQCHASDGVIPPADPRFVRFQATTLPYSRCVSESGGRLDCVACHDPHKNVETNPVAYEARCLACHGGSQQPKANHLRLEAVAASRCSVNPVTGCVTCHMPKVENTMPFTSFTDHHIRVHRPVEPAASHQ